MTTKPRKETPRKGGNRNRGYGREYQTWGKPSSHAMRLLGSRR